MSGDNPKCPRCNRYCKKEDFTPKTSGRLYKTCLKCRTESLKKVKKCIVCKTKQPVFGLPDAVKIEYCGDCKKVDMIDLKNPKCIVCKRKRPSYGLPDADKAEYCNDCIKTDMIDLKNPKCIVCKKKRPSYGLSDADKAEYCNDCKKTDMLNIKSPKCIVCKTKQPVFGLPDADKAEYCNDCKKTDMLNIKSSKCITPLCQQYSKIEKYCLRCYYQHNPTDKRLKKIKFKEREIINYIQQEFKGLNLILDKPLIGDTDCINIRPDVLINLNKHSIIVECDENQHKGINYKCEEARMLKIQETLNRPVVFIRFNPDSYIENYKKVLSCFKVDKKMGFNTIPKNQLELWKNRLQELKATILQNIDYNDDIPFKVVKLFYDDITKNTEEEVLLAV